MPPSSDSHTAARSGGETGGELVRAAIVRIVDDGAALLLVDRSGVVRRLDGDSAALARAVLEEAAAPRTAEALRAAIAARAEVDAAALGPAVDQAIELLAGAGALVRIPDSPPAPTGARVVLAVTGAAAAVHTPALALALQRRGWIVEIALSRAARRFVPRALAAITHRAPHTSMVPHIALATWADLVLVCPATATTIGRIAGGDFSDLPAAVALTTRAPVVLVPSMNPAMRDAPAVRRNLARCAEDGFLIVHGAAGVEIAERPEARTSVPGAAPPPEEVAAIVDALWRAGAVARRAPSTAFESATPALDADVAAALAAHAPPPRTLLDAGTGLGVVARHAAAAGYQVVAVDTDEPMLELARAQSGDAPIVWLRDDVCAPALATRFGVVVDRGCLNVLPRPRRAAWAAAMRRLVAPGGVLIVQAFGEPPPLDGFAPVSTAPSTLSGQRAVLAVFTRR